MPKPLALAVGGLTAVQASFGLSTSVEFRSPVAVGVPGVALADAAGLDHRPGGDAGDHRGIVGAIDGDGDQLGGAVDREGA